MTNAQITFAALVKAIVGAGVIAGLLCTVPALSAQDRDRDRDSDHDRDRMTRLERGTVIVVHTSDTIEVERRDNQIYRAIVDQDVRGDNGRLAIPRGSNVELIVRVNPDNDLILDLESVSVNGNRYAVKTDPNRQEARRDDSLVGSIVGAIQGGEARGRTVRIPRDSILTFRLDRSLDMGVADRGRDREGRHYHDYYDDDHDR
jgi:hypothetical protein